MVVPAAIAMTTLLLGLVGAAMAMTNLLRGDDDYDYDEEGSATDEQTIADLRVALAESRDTVHDLRKRFPPPS